LAKYKKQTSRGTGTAKEKCAFSNCFNLGKRNLLEGNFFHSKTFFDDTIKRKK
jgi:hypothetical protein